MGLRLLSPVLHSWSYRLRVCVNVILSITSGPKGDEITGGQ